MLAIGAVVLGLTSLSASLQGRSDLNWLERAVLFATRPVLDTASRVSGSARSLWGRYVHLVGLEEENAGLRAIVEGLRTEQARLTEVGLENERLRDLLALTERTIRPTVPAEVIGEDVTTEYRVIMINKGRQHGVRTNGAVVTPVRAGEETAIGAVVGKVMQAGDVTSKVLLVVDPRAAVDVLVQRSRAKAVVTGQGRPLCDLSYLDRLEDVRVGDIVVTSGLGGIYPKGLRVGTVQSVEPASSGLFQAAELKPAVDFSRLEEVLVLLAGEAELAS